MGGSHLCSPVAKHFVDKMWLLSEYLLLKTEWTEYLLFFPRGLNLIEDILLKLSLDRLFVVVQCEQRRFSFTVKSEHNIDLRVGC